ncbi:uncharacterized protein LOC128174701 [Crassostrea angulata]|uniref:uncharacterized protein LOC128174701 n=1 Tax=Magallana angulata TaxID=2784310 RepID=UPI0022B11013|nr:uncharacterized protein LOC128174701 [Crassostrea angulata]
MITEPERDADYEVVRRWSRITQIDQGAIYQMNQKNIYQMLQEEEEGVVEDEFYQTPAARSRGRRGAGRGRGRRGRGDQGPNRVELAARTREERDAHMENCISSLDTNGLRDALRLVCSKQPSFMLDILQTIHGENPEPHDSTVTAPSWCICSNCREMPSEREKVCCNKPSQSCISRLPDFQTVVLDELVLEVAMRYHNDVLAEPRDENFNRSRRHTAYRQYIMWIHGRLGAGNRKVIPSCCVWKIREKFPEP